MRIAVLVNRWIAVKMHPYARRLARWTEVRLPGRYPTNTRAKRRQWQRIVRAPFDASTLVPQACLDDDLHAQRIVEVAAREEDEAFNRWLLGEARRIWEERS